MIFLVEVKFTEYEQIDKLIVWANDAKEALTLAKHEIEENNVALGISNNKNILEIKKIKLNESKVLMKEINW